MEGNILANKTATDRSKTDFYPTPENVTIALLNYLKLSKGTIIWEPACGKGNMSETLIKSGYTVISTELEDFGYGMTGVDFLQAQKRNGAQWIITNPPFGISEKFIKKCIEHNLPFALLFKSQYWHAECRGNKLFNYFKPEAVLPLTWRPDFYLVKRVDRQRWNVFGLYGEKNLQKQQFINL